MPNDRARITHAAPTAGDRLASQPAPCPQQRQARRPQHPPPVAVAAAPGRCLAVSKTSPNNRPMAIVVNGPVRPRNQGGRIRSGRPRRELSVRRRRFAGLEPDLNDQRIVVPRDQPRGQAQRSTPIRQWSDSTAPAGASVMPMCTRSRRTPANDPPSRILSMKPV